MKTKIVSNSVNETVKNIKATYRSKLSAPPSEYPISKLLIFTAIATILWIGCVVGYAFFA